MSSLQFSEPQQLELHTTLLKAIRRYIDISEKRGQFAKRKRDQVQQEIFKLDRQIHELIRMKTQGLISDREFLEHKAVFQEKKSAMQISHASEKLNTQNIRQQLHQIKEPLTRPSETW